MVVLAGRPGEEWLDAGEDDRDREGLAFLRSLRSLPLALGARGAPPRPFPFADFDGVLAVAPPGLGGWANGQFLPRLHFPDFVQLKQFPRVALSFPVIDWTVVGVGFCGGIRLEAFRIFLECSSSTCTRA